MTASEILPRSDLQRLLSHQAQWCVSIFMTTHPSGSHREQVPIRLKNLLRQATERLTEAGLRRAQIDELLRPASRLLADAEFWRFPSQGLALFLAPDFSYQLQSPLRFEDLVVVADRFEIKPLLPLLTENGRYFILALSQKQNRLLEATRYGVRRVPTPKVPRSLGDALQYDDPERQLQFHTRSGGPPMQGRRPAMFHGHGAVVDDAKANVLRYCQQIDRGLHDVLREERVPLVLAAVEFEQAIYRDANTYPHLIEQGLPGNPDGLSDEELARQTWPLVEPRFRAAREAAANQYRAFQSNGRSSSDLSVILPAAWQGRVDTLFACRDTHVWGSFHPETLELRRGSADGRAPGEYDLIDEAARYTLSAGGTVYVVDRDQLPGPAEVAATFRY